MRHKRVCLALSLISLVPAVMLASLALSQDRLGQNRGRLNTSGPGSTGPTAATDDVPAAALLTERGKQLADRLRILRLTEATLGAKHPSLAGVQAQIAEVKRELAAWAPAENPFRARDEALRKTLPSLSDQDLRQLVLKMAAKIEQLEARIETLEQRTLKR